MTELMFKVDFASDQYPAKKGYDDSMGFIRSFSTELVTPDTFTGMILEGRAYCSAFLKRSPESVGRPDAATSKINQNFESASLITLDMDDYSGEGDAVEMILNDPFYQRYGHAIVHSSSSTPEHPKLHVIYILETPITDADTYSMALNALLVKYPWADKSCKDLLRTNFSAVSPEYHLHGQTLPFQDLWKHVVAPYQRDQQDRQIEHAKDRERNLIEWESRPKVDLTKDRLQNYLNTAIEGVMNELAQASVTRNLALTRASFRLASFMQAPWASPGMGLFAGIEDQLVQACTANGYEQKYGRQSQPGHETVRVFRACERACTEPAKEPLWLNTPMNTGLNGYGSHITHVITSTTDEELQEALDARYMEGYKQGWLDGYVTGLDHGGREVWEGLGFSELVQGMYELGWDAENNRVTIPQYDQEGRLMNVEYRSVNEDASGWDVEYENNGLIGSLYQPDTSVKASSTALLVTDSLVAIQAAQEMMKLSARMDIDPWMIYSVPDASMIPECSALLGELDAERIIMVVPLQNSSISESQMSSMRTCCQIVRPAASLDNLIRYNDDMSWLERLIKMS